MTVGFIEKTRCVSRGAEIRRILDTKALRQASNLELLRESIVVESVGTILPGVAVERVEVGGLEGVLPALRGPLVT